MAAFDPKFLLDSEVDYELRIRNSKTVRDVENRKRILKRALITFPCGDLTLIDPLYAFNDEQLQINATLANIQDIVTNLPELRETEESFIRLKSRLCHVFFRIGRIKLEPNNLDATSTFKNESMATYFLLEDELYSKIKFTNVLNAVNVGNQFQQVARHNSVPVYKWNISFDGTPNKLYSFLERVEELAVARNISKAELFNSASDLFIGKAHTWLRANQLNFNNWDELISAIKTELLPSEYDDQLWNEIKKRTQGKNESISIYISVMETLFKRLTVYPEEQKRIKIIREGLLPDFQILLALTDIFTIEELKIKGRRIEEINWSKNNYVPPPRKSELIEPNLAYVESATSSVASFDNQRPCQRKVNTILSASKHITCFNCKEKNHTFRNCTLPKNKFCFKCGESNCTIKTCKKCSKNPPPGDV